MDCQSKLSVIECPSTKDLILTPRSLPVGGRMDVFDLSFHLARDQTEKSLRTKMTSIKERMVQLQDVQKKSRSLLKQLRGKLNLKLNLLKQEASSSGRRTNS